MTLAAALLVLAVLAITGQTGRGTPGEAGDHTSTKALEGADVVNRAGEKIGEVHGFLMNPQSGKVDFAIIDSGGFLGMGEKSVLVPWAAFQVEPRRGEEEARVVLDATSDKLQGGFEYKEDEAGQVPVDEIFGYWGLDRAATKEHEKSPAADGTPAPQAPAAIPPPSGTPPNQNPNPPSGGSPD